MELNILGRARDRRGNSSVRIYNVIPIYCNKTRSIQNEPALEELRSHTAVSTKSYSSYVPVPLSRGALGKPLALPKLSTEDYRRQSVCVLVQWA